MLRINRSTLLVRPKQTYKDFCSFVESHNWDSDCYVLLVPDLQDEKECIAYLSEKERFKNVFRQLLEDSGKLESSYPDINRFEIFLEWFELEYHGVVFDCANDYLPVGQAKFDLYYRKGTPNWYIGSSGMLSEKDWKCLEMNPNFSHFEEGYSNQTEIELKYRRKNFVGKDQMVSNKSIQRIVISIAIFAKAKIRAFFTKR